jgi:cobalt-zinc-cadmium efflux system membrane fusion protein
MSRYFPRALAHQLPTLVVLSCLAALGWWGAVNDWRVKGMLPWPPERPKTPKEPSKTPENPNVSPDEIKLDSPESAGEAGISTGEARREGVVHVVNAPGVLAFANSHYAQASARVNGTAWRVLAGSGKPVRKDEVLALVTAPEAGKARADLLTAWVTHDVRAKQLARFESAGSSVPERQILDARQMVREARVALLGAHQGLANLGLGFSLDSLRDLSDEQVHKRVRRLGLPPSVGDADDLPASLIPIVSPIEGVVIRSEILLGEQTGPGQTSFVVADTSKLWLRIDVRQEDIDRVSLRQSVTFRASATGQNASGVLTWISAEVDPRTHTVKARAEIYNPTGRLRPATFGQVEIEVGSVPRVTVPDASIQWDGEARRVFVRRDDKTFEPRIVLTGASRARRTELLDPQSLLPASLAGQIGCDTLGTLGLVAACNELLVPVTSGDVVATEGSNVLKSEMLKGRIGGDE